MASILSAHVVLSSGDDLTARIANLTPSSVFVQTKKLLPFRERVTVTFFSVSVQGYVVHASLDPPGVVVALEASPEVRVMIEERMDQVPRIWPGRGAYDRIPTVENAIPAAITESNDFDEPTNTGLPAITADIDPSDPIDPIDPAEHLEAPAGIQEDVEQPRLRATTVVGKRDSDEPFVEEPTEDGIPSG